jgi:hypothetical protein
MILEKQALIEIKILMANDGALKKAIEAATGPQEVAQALSDASKSDRIQAASQSLRDYFSTSAFHANGELSNQALDSVVGGMDLSDRWHSLMKAILL